MFSIIGFFFFILFFFFGYSFLNIPDQKINVTYESYEKDETIYLGQGKYKLVPYIIPCPIKIF